ncbi:hypothetical protein Trydic_g12991 [Trypoxylus dichotomus]
MPSKPAVNLPTSQRQQRTPGKLPHVNARSTACRNPRETPSPRPLTFTDLKIADSGIGVRTKMGELIDFLSSRNVDLVALSETKLAENRDLRLSGYSVVRKDGRNSQGEVVIAIRNTIPFQRIALPEPSSLEAVAIRLANSTVVHMVVSLYNSPRKRLTVNQLDTLFGHARKVLIAGDFNARHYSWNCYPNNANGTVLHNYQRCSNIASRNAHAFPGQWSIAEHA